MQTPDAATVTREAEAAGYRLPDQAEHTKPEYYYYRRVAANTEQFELVRKVTAPVSAPRFRARVSEGKFVGFEHMPEVPTPHEVVPVEWTKDQVVARVRETSFGGYAEMLERQGIASRAVVDAAIATSRGVGNQKGAVTLDGLRAEVKAYFRERVEAKLLDPRLDATASYRNMQAMVEGLSEADRGALTQRWYAGRSAPTGRTGETYEIERTTGPSKGMVETRLADLVVDGEVRVVKDVTGKIDEDQLGSYQDLLHDDKTRASLGAKQIRYVFTRPEGAIANLERMADALASRELMGRLTVEVFDRSGSSHLINTPAEAMAMLKSLRGAK